MKSLRDMIKNGGACLLAGAALASVAAPASAQVSLNLLADVDLAVTADTTGNSFIGSNPSAVAWDGTNAWIGGYNSSGVVANTGIVRISNVLTAPTFGATFGTFSTQNNRGMTGLATRTVSVGGTPTQVLAASLDDGTGRAVSVREFNATTSALRWNIGDAGAGNDSTRRGNGVAFDPGFNGAGSNQGVAYLSIGSGRRHLLNADSGVYINGQNAGAIINLTPVSTTFRDLDFDPASGDLYTRESNRVTFADRNGDNTFVGGGSTVISPAAFATATTVDNQNIAFVNATTGTPLNFLMVNNRSAVGGGQAFTSVVTALGLTGTTLSINYNGFTAANGNGAYDFSFNAASQTLAISDFANRRLYIFGVNQPASANAPEPATLALLGLGAVGLVARARRRK